VQPPASARGHFAGTPTRSLHARRGCVGRYFRVPALRGITRFARPAPRRPVPPPAARSVSPRPPAWG
jgi:hypothetical protein